MEGAGVACIADGLRRGEALAGEGGEARRGGEVGIGGGGVGELDGRGQEGLGGRAGDVAGAGEGGDDWRGVGPIRTAREAMKSAPVALCAPDTCQQ